MAEDVLANDDRIVHDDPENQDEGKRRYNVRGDVESWHQHDHAQERDRNPQTDPEREAQLEKQREHQEHETETRDPVAQHERQPVVQHARLVLPHRQREPFRQGCGRAIDVVDDETGDLQITLVTGAKDRDEDRRLDVEPRELIGLREPIDDGRNVAQM